MRRVKTLVLLTFTAALTAFAPAGASAHCDSVDGPVATAALRALETGNVNLVLPYAPAEAEPELTAAFGQAAAVRKLGGAAGALAGRFFMETAVRLHRAGEHAPYTGLKPAGRDFGPAIPAAERALATGRLEPLLALMREQVAHGIGERFEHARETQAAPIAPATHAEVAGARERASAELALVGYVQGLYAAAQGASGHAE